MTRAKAEKRGRSAETLACWYLRLHGWRILARRARLAPRFMREGDELRIDALFMVPRRWPRHVINVWLG